MRVIIGLLLCLSLVLYVAPVGGRKVRKRCKPLTFPDTDRSCNQAPNAEGWYRDGTVCNFACRSGCVKDIGGTKRVCKVKGRSKWWTGGRGLKCNCRPCVGAPSHPEGYTSDCGAATYPAGHTCVFTCPAGYVKVSGNERKLCVNGRWRGQDLVCKETDECISNPCANGATCEDEVDGYNCTCAPGYEGDQCETETDECISNPCANGATCEDEVDGYNCTCAPGYEGDQCETEATATTQATTTEPTTQATTTGEATTTQATTTVFPTIEPCNMTPDLFFVLDGSGSVSDADFDKVKQFVATTASAFTIGLTETRVGVLQYSSSNSLECNLGDHADESSFVSAISTMTKLSGGTNTGAALEYARQNAAWRPAPTPKIMIVLTDGQSADSVVAASQALAADGVTVFAIGVGNIDQSELLQIANNNPGRVFGLADFNVLARNINLIVSTVCIEPTTQATTIDPTELPTLEPCNMNSDLFFVLDGSGSVSNADFDKVKQFVKTVSSAFTIGLTETRVGVLQYSDSNALECNLGDHADESSFVSAISTMTYQRGGSTNTGAALEFARQNAAWRPAPTPKIMIVLTDGQSHDSVVAASQALAADGVTVFAIGVGNIDQSELLQIANNNPSHVFGLADFNVLARNINLFVSTVCNG